MRFFSSKIGIELGTYFFKKVPNFEIVWPTPATPRDLTVKGVYEVSYIWYGQIIGSVCSSLKNMYSKTTEIALHNLCFYRYAQNSARSLWRHYDSTFKEKLLIQGCGSKCICVWYFMGTIFLIVSLI